MGIKVEDRTSSTNDASDPEDESDDRKPDTRGRAVARALIGVEAILFEIVVPEVNTSAAPSELGNASAGATYYINGMCVHPTVYRDALKTMDKDRWCPNCNGIHVDGHDPSEEGGGVPS